MCLTEVTGRVAGAQRSGRIQVPRVGVLYVGILTSSFSKLLGRPAFLRALFPKRHKHSNTYQVNSYWLGNESMLLCVVNVRLQPARVQRTPRPERVLRLRHDCSACQERRPPGGKRGERGASHPLQTPQRVGHPRLPPCFKAVPPASYELAKRVPHPPENGGRRRRAYGASEILRNLSQSSRAGLISTAPPALIQHKTRTLDHLGLVPIVRAMADPILAGERARQSRSLDA